MKYLLEYACISHIGKCRSNNQDNFSCTGSFMECENVGTSEPICSRTDTATPRLFAVFDGMGGEYQGEVASYIASRKAAGLNVFTEKPPEDILSLCKNINVEICQYADRNGIPSMGTTAAILLFDKRRIHLCNIGDSKIFRWSKDGLEQLSEDHLGIAAFGAKPPLSQNLGIPETELIIAPYTVSGYYNIGDKYLICSDGLTDMVSLETIKTVLCDNSPCAAAFMLTEEALNNGGKDNITLIVIEIQRQKFSWKELFGK